MPEVPPAASGIRPMDGLTPSSTTVARLRDPSRAGALGLEPTAIKGWFMTTGAEPAGLYTSEAVEFATPGYTDADGNLVWPCPGLFVSFAPEATEAEREAIARMLGGARQRYAWIPNLEYYRVPVRTGAELLDRASGARSMRGVAFAEPDFTAVARFSEVIPTDPSLNQSWALRNFGQTIGGSVGISGIDLRATTAWDRGVGSPQIRVAVFEVGMQLSHPDLNLAAGRDFTTGAVNGVPGGGGNDPSFLDELHGTQVAGCISGRMNNGIGSCGVAPGCPTVPIRFGVFAPTPQCPGCFSLQLSWLVNALNWCVANGTLITNHSYALSQVSQAVDEAFAATRAAGAMHFAGAGNDSNSQVSFPASSASVMAVGSVNNRGLRSAFSNYGDQLDLVAPGEAIFTTDRTGAAGVAGDYAMVSGTSFASPHAAGVAALMRSRDPSLTPQRIESVLFATARDSIGTSCRDYETGWGMIDAAAAVAAVGDVFAGCPEDVNRDGIVDAADLSNLLGDWGACVCSADITGDGVVDAADLGRLLGLWGSDCGGSWMTVLEQLPDPAVVASPALRSAIAATGLPWRVRDNASQVEMLLVPPGTFDMGCVEASLNVGCAEAELPAHPVTITRPYYLGRYELTQRQWSIAMGSNPSLFQGWNYNCSMDRPVDQVTFEMADAFLQRTGLRLPTEAEWEMACRAGASTAFPATAAFPLGSNNDGPVGLIAWWFMNASGETKPVGGLASNGLGLHDMLGNVYEFTSDWYGAYAPESTNNPTGPASGTAKVMRGGSWTSTQDGVRSSFRASSPTNSWSSNRGFRVARSTGGSLAWATVLEQTPNPAIVTDPAIRASLIAAGLPWRVRDNATQIELLLVPPGTFTMGCDFGSSDWPCIAEELPTHQVNLLAAYYIGRYEVTQAEWQARMGSNPSRFQGSQYPGAPSRPVEQVTWTQVQGFLGNTGLRLPTEAEWEYACRAGTTTPYHSGPGFPNGTADDGVVTSMSWGFFNSAGRTNGIGGRTANALGFHDMLGNVYELVGDRFGLFTASAQTDPAGPASGTDRVMRGGGWTSTPDGLRASTRQAVAPTTWSSNLGLRVARSP